MDPREIWEHLKDNPIKLQLVNVVRVEHGLPPITKEYIETFQLHSGGRTGGW